MTNEDYTTFAGLNDMSATMIGATRDEINFWREISKATSKKKKAEIIDKFISTNPIIMKCFLYNETGSRRLKRLF